jgi:aldehyde dehydrogenase (NAD+)
MSEEIFGPLLPIITYENFNDAIEFIKKKEHPLTLYIFSADEQLCATVERETQSGSLVINDTVIQLATSRLPFGGVGASGTGSYHGRAGFEAFSHMRSVLKRPFIFDLPVRYRPLARWKLWILRKLMKFPLVRQSGLPPA